MIANLLTPADDTFVDKPNTPLTFKVSIQPMNESHRKTYWVVLENSNRPAGTKIWDSVGRLTPFGSEDPEHARHEAKVWAKFLGVPEQASCDCLMCKGGLE